MKVGFTLKKIERTDLKKRLKMGIFQVQMNLLIMQSKNILKIKIKERTFLISMSFLTLRTRNLVPHTKISRYEKSTSL